MKIGILTSSRADFGIYLPLLHALKADSFFEFEIIAFGTHLSFFHGRTIDQIVAAEFQVHHKIESLLTGDSQEAISTAIGLTTIKFAKFWEDHKDYYDLVFCLGDRYEMFSAVTAGVAFPIKFAHLHGGETTLGATDNIFRHFLSHASTFHFCSTEIYAERLRQMLDDTSLIFNVGALSLDNIETSDCYTTQEFKEIWGIDLTNDTVLLTLHPETVTLEANADMATNIAAIIKEKNNVQFVITMPNADVGGNLIRDIFYRHLDGLNHVKMIENFGTKGYFTCLKDCLFVMGNSSSGIIEAASFGKYVINIGDRQKGRAAGGNIIHTSHRKEDILKEMNWIMKQGPYTGANIYSGGRTSAQITKILKNYWENNKPLFHDREARNL